MGQTGSEMKSPLLTDKAVLTEGPASERQSISGLVIEQTLV